MSIQIQKSIKLLSCLALVGLISACESKNQAAPPVLNGKWASTDGVYVAHFDNGQFQAIGNDTGNVISQGSYIVYSSSKVRINWSSNLSGDTNQAECEKPSNTQLDCVDKNGNRFSLRRSI